MGMPLPGPSDVILPPGNGAMNEGRRRVAECSVEKALCAVDIFVICQSRERVEKARFLTKLC